MIKNVLSNIGGVGLYGVLSICLFFVVFTSMVLWAMRLKKPFIKSMSGLPLNDGETKMKEPSHE
jgi:cytochrome c oxidase cbb3-type subunit 4